MINEQLVGLLETILGSGDSTSKGNYAFYCTNCKHHKKKLEVNCIVNKNGENPWNCWVCNFRGKTIASLFKKLNIPSSKYEELNIILGTSYKYNNKQIKTKFDVNEQIILPKEFQTFIGMSKYNIIGRYALNYLLNTRKISYEDILKHNIGFAETGKYKNKIIIPSYSKSGEVDYFIARAFDDSTQKIDAPKSDKNFIGFESTINWDLPIILVEGPFDAISAKRNAIPLFGKTLSPKLKEYLQLNRVKQIYLSLDNDAKNSTIKLAKELLDLGKEVFVVNMDSKDPNDMGFKEYTHIISNSKPFTLSDLLRMKMEN